MKAPTIARVLGIAFLIATIAAVVPKVLVPAGLTDEYIQMTSGYGFLAGIFAVNGVHDLVHGIFAIWGIGAGFSFAASVRYCRSVACIYLVLAVLGAIPITNTLFGLAPIYGWDVLLHLVIAVVAAYGGFTAASVAAAPDELPLRPPA
ncbi:MAG: DUF4383 domain-containing protein [Candidatus Eremiobacteraeota bacterium]|nr:DUF4383 domain-containing protein [Candidatus Eremiobacteraeota bacterium]